MKAFAALIAVLVLALLPAGSVAQSQATEFAGFLVRTNLQISDTRLLLQVVPPCYVVDYELNAPTICSSSGSVLGHDIFFLDYVPTVGFANDPPPATQTVTISLHAGTNKTVVPPTAVITAGTVNGTTYQTCPIDAAGFVRNAGGNQGACGITYLCSQICQLVASGQRLTVRIQTASNENPLGVVFDLRLMNRDVPVQVIQIDNRFQQPLVQPPVGERYFKPSVQQLHYLVDVGPAGPDAVSTARFIAKASAYVQFSVLVDNFRIANESGIPVNFTATTQGTWDLTLNTNDLAVSDRGIQTEGHTLTPTVGGLNNLCVTSFAQLNPLDDSSDAMQVNIPGCQSRARHYIAVGMTSTAGHQNRNYTWDVLPFFTPLFQQFIPELIDITTNGQIVNSQLGTVIPGPIVAATNPVQEKYFFINLPNPGGATQDSSILEVTVFGVDHGFIASELRLGCLGYLGGCTNCPVLRRCREGNNGGLPQGAEGKNYCKMVLEACEYQPNATTVYILSVRARDDQVAGSMTEIDFSVTARVLNRVVQDVRQLPSVSDAAPVTNTMWSDIRTVEEQHYNHYLFTVDTNQVTQNYWLQVEMYTNHVQEEVTLYYNPNALAGSTNAAGYRPQESCYTSTRQCSTSGKAVNGQGSCVMVFEFCNLQPNMYFSVLGHDASNDSIINDQGYARHVSYSIMWTLYTQPIDLTIDKTETYSVWKQPVGFTHTPQFRFILPDERTSFFVDQVRVRIDDIGTGANCGGAIQGYIACGVPTGRCPCYSSQGVQTLPADLILPRCRCNNGTYYVNVVAPADANCFKAVTFKITPYVDDITVRGTITSAPIVNVMRPDRLVFDERNTEVFTTGTAFESHVYRYMNQDGESDDALRVTVKFQAHRNTGDGTLSARVLVSSDSVAQVNDGGRPWLGQDCAQVCNAAFGGSSYSYCTLIVRPCNFTQGDFFIRVVGLDTDLVSQDLDYTLYVDKLSYTPTALVLGTPVKNAIRSGVYHHYSVNIPAASPWARAELYVNHDQMNLLSLFHNRGLPAGNLPCYNATRRCDISLNDGYCDMFFYSCDLVGSEVYFFAVHYDADRINNRNPDQNTIGDLAHQYTFVVRVGQIEQLDVINGFPVTGLVYNQQENLYSFTITDAQISAGNILRVQVQSISPMPTTLTNIKLRTVITNTQPGARCACSMFGWVDEFETTDYECDLQGRAGTYYMSVKGLSAGATPPFDPISYTVRAYFLLVPSVTLSVPTIPRGVLLPEWVGLPNGPLNNDDWIDFTFSAPPAGDSVLHFEIADLIPTNNADFQFLDVWLAHNVHGSPVHQTSFANFGVNSNQCFIQTCRVTNTLGPQPNGTVMCRFQLPPCSRCPTGNYHVTIMPKFLEPEPNVLRQANFTVRAWISPIVEPFGIPFNTTDADFRNFTLVGATPTFTFAEPTAPSIYCETRFGSNAQLDYFFKLRPLTHANAYERTRIFQADAAVTWFFNDGSNGLIGQSGAVNCGCQIGVGNCGTFNCPSFTQTFYGMMRAPCNNNPVTVNGRSFAIKTDVDRNYVSQGASQAIAGTGFTNGSLSPGEFRDYTLNLGSTTGINLALAPRIRVFLTFAAGAGSAGANSCFGPTGTLFPGQAASSYCPACCAYTDITLEPCCQHPETSYTLTMYGGRNPDSFANFSIQVLVDNRTPIPPVALNIAAGSGVVQVPSSLINEYIFYFMDILPEQFGRDDVLNFQASANTLTRTVFINRFTYAGAPGDSACFGNFYSQNCGNDTDACNVQMPLCYFLANGGYGRYFVSFKAAGANSTGNTLLASIQRTTTFTTSATGTVPNAEPGESNFYVHHKFVLDRPIGDFGLTMEDVRVQLRLARGANGNNTLRLHVHSERTNFALTKNPLAGTPGIAGLTPGIGGNCDYTDEIAGWTCQTGNDTFKTAAANAQTTSVVGHDLFCTRSYCLNNAPVTYLDKSGNGHFFYVSVRNTEAEGTRTPTAYTLSLSVETTPRDQVSNNFYGLTAVATNTDDLAVLTNVCNVNGTNSGGCTAINVSPPSVNQYFLVPFSSLSVANLQYITVNVTRPTVGVTVHTWTTDNCEPATAGGTTCLAGVAQADCFIRFQPCDFESFFHTGNGATRTPVFRTGQDMWVRVRPTGGAWPATGANFTIEVRLTTPRHIVINNLETAALNQYQDTFTFWDERYLMFTFSTLQNADAQLMVTVTSSCESAANLVQVYRTKDVYHHPDPMCDELTPGAATVTNTPFTETIPACQLTGGNYHIALRAPQGAVQFGGVETNITGEGRVTPQIRATITAKLVITPHTEFPLECTVAVPRQLNTGSTINNYVAWVEHENFGTQLQFGYSGCLAGQCTIMIISPLWRQSFNVDGDNTYIDQPRTSWRPKFYGDNLGGTCDNPVCTDVGVYCLNPSALQTGEDTIIPAHEVRAGRWHIILTRATQTAVTLFSNIHRKDYPIALLNAELNWRAVFQGAVRDGFNVNDDDSTDDDDEDAYQFFKIVAPNPRATFQTQITFTYPFPVGSTTGFNAFIHKGENGFPSAYHSNLGLGTNGLNSVATQTTANINNNCAAATLTPGGGCQITDTSCDSGAYYVGVYVKGSETCTIHPYIMTVTGRTQLTERVLTSGLAECGTVQLIAPVALPNPQVPPQQIWYRLDLTGVDTTFARLQISARVFRNIQSTVNRNIRLSYNSRPASQNCNTCSVTTTAATDLVTLGDANGNIECRLGSEVWITVEALQNQPTDFWVKAVLRQFTRVPITGINPSGTIAGDSVLVYDNTAGNFAIVRSSLPAGSTVHVADATDAHCTNGCPAIDTGCAYLGRKGTYFIRIPFTPTRNVDCNVQNNQTLFYSITAVPITSLVDTLATQTLQLGEIHFYRRTLTDAEIATTSAISIYVTELEDGHVTINAACNVIDLGACNGNTRLITFASSAAQSGTHTFTTDGTAIQPSCGCREVLIAVSPVFDASGCTGGGACNIQNNKRVTYNLRFTTTNNVIPTSGVTPLTPAWIAGAIRRSTCRTADQVQWYSLTSTPEEGLMHIGVAYVNGTAKHDAQVTVYRDNCPVCTFNTANCQSGQQALGAPGRDDNEDETCYCHEIAPRVIGANGVATRIAHTYHASVTPIGAISGQFNALTYQIQGFNTFATLTGSYVAHQIIGESRHYYKVPAKNNGAMHSVVLSVEVVDGPRLLIEWSDSLNYRAGFIDRSTLYSEQTPISNGKGWHQAKICHFGTCELSVPTRAQHPDVENFYVWITTVATSGANPRGFMEKPTNYRIRATTGLANCGGIQAGGFCSDANLPGPSFWQFRKPILRHQEAQNRFNCLQCRCPTPDAACNATMKVFSCHESFRECDADGFWVPLCRDECRIVSAQCGSFVPNQLNCACERTEFNCQSARYADAEPCSGVVAPPTPTVTPTPEINEGPVNEDDFVDLEIDFSEAAEGPVKQTCDEEELEVLMTERLNIPRSQLETRDLFVFVAQMRLFGAEPGRSATQLAVEFINLVNSRPLELVGTCLEQARAVIATPPLTPPSSELQSPPAPSPDNDDNDLFDDEGNLNSELLPPIIIQFVPGDEDISGASMLSTAPVLFICSTLLVMLLSFL